MCNWGRIAVLFRFLWAAAWRVSDPVSGSRYAGSPGGLAARPQTGTEMTAMPHRHEVTSTPWVWVVLAAVVLLMFSMRYAVFSDMEPRIDQAYGAACMRDLVSADHLLPKGTVSHGFWQALETDNRSLLFAIGRPIYVGPQLAFELVPFFIGSALLLLVGYSYSHVVAFGVLASALTLVPITVMFRRCTQTTDLSSLAGALFYSSATYVSLFSPWGVHNFGVFMLVLAVALITPLMAGPSAWTHSCTRRLAALGAVTLLAAYSHFINPLLVPLTVLLGLVGLPETSVRRKIQLVAFYGLIMCVGLAPVGLLSAFLHQIRSNFLVYANADSSLGSYLAGIPQRAGLWFVSGMRLVSVPGVVAGITGLAWMAWATRFHLPFWSLVAHFTCYCLVPGFTWNGSNTYLRTYNYVIPFLAIGMGWLLLQVMVPNACFRRCRTLRIFVGVCLAWHLAIQIPINGYEAWARRHSRDFAVDYLDGQGELRPIVRSIQLRAGTEPVIFWEFAERFAYLSLSSNTSNAAPSALDSTLKKLDRGESLKIAVPTKGYVVANQRGLFSEENLSAAFFKIHRRKAEVEFVTRWPCSIPAYGPFVLYRIDIR